MSRGTGCRIIQGLIWAEPCERPKNIPKSKPRGRKAAGLKYERDLACGLKLSIVGKVPIWHGQWFKFEDSRGTGVCQTDIVLRTPVGIAILESKYTWTEAGHTQIEQLYVPVLEAANPGVPAFGFVVCKVLTSDVRPEWVCRDLASAIRRSSSGLRTVLHWIGAGLEPLKIAA